jgi:hypothetical protein
VMCCVGIASNNPILYRLPSSLNGGDGTMYRKCWNF